MRRIFYALVFLFLLFYVGAHYYLGSRFLALASVVLGSATWVYWGLIILAAITPVATRVLKSCLPRRIIDRASIHGNYWLAMLFYGLVLWGAADLVRLLVPMVHMGDVRWGLAVLTGLGMILAYGYRRARAVRISRYDVTLDKHVPGLASLRIALVSDLHLGTPVNNARLVELVERIQALAPDIVFFAGDTIDGELGAFAAEEMPRLLQRLKPPFGCFAVLGNHEYISTNQRDAVRQLESSGVEVLVDTYRHVSGRFYVVGRDDAYVWRRGVGVRRRSALAAIMAEVDHAQPIFLLDHQPIDLGEAEKNGVDLMLSGHTHHGQFFPIQLLTRGIFAVDWGYLRRGLLQVIVSCGFGTWGPPIRTSGYSEIVEVNVTFREEG